MKLLLILVSCAVFSGAIFAAAPESAPTKDADAVCLWRGDAPLAHGNTAEDTPAITPYLLGASGDGAPRPCVVICPGGGYASRVVREGDHYARWFNEIGFSAFVLRYRLGSHGYAHPAPLLDAARAVRFVRAHAAEYGIDPARVGVVGSSAGGHLASTLLTHFDGGNPGAADPVETMSSRPDFGILLYPVVSMDTPYTHINSRRRLLGRSPDAETIAELSNEKQVKENTPPTFIVHARNDPAVPVENSLSFAAALSAKKVPFELHVYEKAGAAHGFGLGSSREWNPAKRHPWLQACTRWLAQMGFAPKSESK